jgi:geranyl-CoA carboxylase alpha subunit
MSAPALLIANRGEIACRIISTARAMGIETVAVYSDADAGAAHVRHADRAVRIGPAAAGQSYLHAQNVIHAAQQSGARLVHPGYGFLSENAAFARAVGEAGLVFVGPPPEAIAAMGDKARAKARMIEAGVPVLPGWQGEDQSPDQLRAQAEAVGYPLLIKAAAGGGGRGMRLVERAADFDEALASARREAASAFGDEAVLLERYVARGRHVEIQVLADAHGAVVHLFERDCSAQRRRQKVVEEAPSPAVDAALRARMGEAAVAAAKAVGYFGAGTVEFLLDETGSPFFLEMNTRLQVEHPVTEMITGLDLVEQQIRIALGEPLAFSQSDLAIAGSAVEARIYAEDPLDAFRPQAGRVARFEPDATLPGVRVDAGVESGDVIPPDYDSMVAKIIAHGPDRRSAIERLVRALEAAPLLGVRNNRKFLIDLLRSKSFEDGQVFTRDLDAWLEAGAGPFEADLETRNRLAALAAGALCATAPGALRSGSVRSFGLDLVEREETIPLRVEQTGPGELRVGFADASERFVRFPEGVRGGVCPVEIDGVRRRASIARLEPRRIHVALDDADALFEEPVRLGGEAAGDASRLVSPVAGRIASVRVAQGDAVKAGDVLVVLEAMKMETPVTARADGVVTALHAREGAQAPGGFLLIEMRLEGED